MNMLASLLEQELQTKLKLKDGGTLTKGELIAQKLADAAFKLDPVALKIVLGIKVKQEQVEKLVWWAKQQAEFGLPLHLKPMQVCFQDFQALYPEPSITMANFFKTLHKDFVWLENPNKMVFGKVQRCLSFYSGTITLEAAKKAILDY